MENLQQGADTGERRLMSRINAALRTNYQLITRTDALKDPYDPSFVLPRYFLLLAELDEIDSVQSQLAVALQQESPTVARVVQLMNQKLNLITGALYDAMVETMLPSPSRVNISESGLSFYARERIPPGSHVHLTLSHPENAFHLAATARVVYSEDEDLEGFRTGAYFISLHPNDRAKLAESINQKLTEENELDQFRTMDDY
ncbi:PilZ domain-containing protein [Alkanindiges illinoisensis]|uniref:PilZ domain-containing protein n=1 Tax=Alkanindiges illinoisensis TaxID=197183 RepID=A0A4Y7XHH5_9GAMM|nr:PilZ domain-containing protein [Alkanindiges illinoisensis]TEU30815.1 PilZ domain-containing protein [Alkanindiges illinoisensis]